MSTPKLGTRPKTFSKEVKFPMLDGTEGVIECVFKYRTRREFADFVDESAKKQVDSMLGATERNAKSNTELALTQNKDNLVGVLESWNLDVKLSLDSADQLCDELPAAADAILATYRTAVVEGRLGNS